MKEISKFSNDKRISDKFFQCPALLLLNNFDEKVAHERAVVTMLRGLFPSINIKIPKIRRCVIFNKIPESDLVEMRHYGILINPSGVSMGLKNFLNYKIPDLALTNDISDFIHDETDSDNFGKLKMFGERRPGIVPPGLAAVKLFEIGPRFTLRLYKIHEGIGDKEILYHCSVKKTDSEMLELRQRHEERAKLKSERKAQQEKNVAMKKEKAKKKTVNNGISKASKREKKVKFQKTKV
ncbi:Suppressor of SWI4 1 [Thelohanellus kitauei]|uniref:Suppressor of SWI4 1 n=1 Tax=Thelohanellus kitauei TaxID=669202 RepID=A0A0C2J8F8_THEKT|nr:Suppressor of SWI4 1 [Thelohanellus kitauei]